MKRKREGTLCIVAATLLRTGPVGMGTKSVKHFSAIQGEVMSHLTCMPIFYFSARIFQLAIHFTHVSQTLPGMIL